ncbi:LysR family transcriptional regulator, partial [Pseudomonas gingeri]
MLRELKTFIRVSREGTFVAAGQQLGLTQSAVS